MMLNVDDEYAQSRAREAERRYNDNCKVYYDGAELHFANGNYTEAKKLYEMVVSASCPKATEADIRLVNIRKIEYERNNRTQAIVYELAKDAPIGISVGSYKEKNFSGYYSIRFSPSLFAAMRKDYEKSERSELNVSAGWTTMKIAPVPVWGFFGVGYTGVAEWDEDPDDLESKIFNVHSAISPELGVLGKLGPVALRYTFQYRFALDKDKQDLIGKMRHVFGIGICF